MGGGCWNSNCGALGWIDGEADRSPLLPVGLRSLIVKEC